MRHSLQIVGLVDVDVAAGCPLADPFSMGSHALETDYLWKYFCYQSDVVGLHVRHSASLQESRPTYSHLGGKKISLRDDLFWPSGALNDVVFVGGASLAEQVSRWGFQADSVIESVPAIFVVEPVAYLVQAQRWTTLCFRARSWMLKCHRKEKLGNHPDDICFRQLVQRGRDCLPVSSNTATDLSAIARIGDHLREWAPTILETARAAGTEASVKMRLTDALTMLRNLNFAQQQLGQRRGPGDTSVGFKHSSKRLLECCRLMMHLRRRSSLPQAVAIALDAAIPGIKPERETWEETLVKSLPSQATLSSSQCSLDAALLLHQGRQLSQSKFLLYILADSTPQAGYNLSCRPLSQVQRHIAFHLRCITFQSQSLYTSLLAAIQVPEVLL